MCHTYSLKLNTECIEFNARQIFAYFAKDYYFSIQAKNAMKLLNSVFTKVCTQMKGIFLSHLAKVSAQVFTKTEANF